MTQSDLDKFAALKIEVDVSQARLDECQVRFQMQIAQYDSTMPTVVKDLWNLNKRRIDLCKSVSL